ncbi:MAG: ATP-binding protein, partial [Spirochaetota bacterium]
LSESIRDIFFSVDDHGQVMFWNSFAENKTGLTSDEIIGQPLLSVLPSLEKTDLPEQIDTVQKSKTPLQTRMKLSFGSSFETYNLIIYPIATGVSILAKDISAQIRFQSQLFEQSQILDQLHEAILTTDMEGRIKTVNKQCLNIFRTNISTIRNEHISSIFNQNDRNRVKQLLKHITPDIPYASEEYAITNADGEMLHTLVHISVKKDINEQPNGYIFSIINISESASIRREILQINQDLEHKVKKRTIQLEEEKRRAESANRAKTSFLANMSHEVRTPMNAIVGLIHLLTQTGLDDVQQQYCRKMNNASQNMMSIIADILDYSRIESGNFELNNSRFRLSAILANLRKTIISMLDGKTITASFTVDDGVPSEFVSDPIQLEHVLAIVLDNAVKFTESGSVHLHISSQPETFNMESVMFKIEDTGIGIKNSDIKQMFQPFTQADDTRSRRYGGAGLGLALAKQLVSRMNGQIRVSSTPGSGSVFTITLPLKKIESVAAPNFVNDASSALVAVDTDAWSRESLKAVFSRTGIQSVVLSDIDEAKPYLADTSYSMCVLSLAALSKHDDLSSISPLIDKKHIILLSDYPGQAIPDEYSNFFTIQKPVLDSQILTALSHLRKPHSSSMFMRRKKLDGIRILLVEDNIINRDVAAELLEMEGAIIDSAENGKSALSVLENKTFDVILMDIKMPVMNGITATEIIKKRKDLSHIPVIALSANTDRKDTFGENFCNVISKPFDIAELVSVISSCIGKKITVSTSDSLIQKMKPIDGINMREPIARQNLTVEEYYAQLQSFFNTNINTLSSIKAAYNENDTDTLLKTVQSLIDDSIKIGAETLAASGREFLPFIVGTCRENDCHFIFADLCFKLDNIMKELSDYFSQHGNHGSGDADLIQTGSVYDTLLGNLGYYLAESDTRALEIIDNLFPITSDERRLKVLMTLKNHCQRFDFEGALHYFETNRPVLEGNHE